jgi:predicted MFS family arabinose efflux permease
MMSRVFVSASMLTLVAQETRGTEDATGYRVSRDALSSLRVGTLLRANLDRAGRLRTRWGPFLFLVHMGV